MKTPRETRDILDKLDTQHPGADTELHHTSPFELLVATILSAQSTDARVNYVAPGRWCLRCTGLVTPRRLEFESLTRGGAEAKGRAGVLR